MSWAALGRTVSTETTGCPRATAWSWPARDHPSSGATTTTRSPTGCAPSSARSWGRSARCTTTSWCSPVSASEPSSSAQRPPPPPVSPTSSCCRTPTRTRCGPRPAVLATRGCWRAPATRCCCRRAARRRSRLPVLRSRAATPGWLATRTRRWRCGTARTHAPRGRCAPCRTTWATTCGSSPRSRHHEPHDGGDEHTEDRTGRLLDRVEHPLGLLRATDLGEASCPVHTRPVVAHRDRGGDHEQHQRHMQPTGGAEVTVVVAEEDQRHAGEELQAEEDRHLSLHDVGPPQHGRRWRAAAHSTQERQRAARAQQHDPRQHVHEEDDVAEHGVRLSRRSARPRTPARAYSRPRMRCGVDTGGTFTDVVFDDGRVAKLLSTPTDPSRAVAAALDVRPALLAHGTTVATNALLERRGASVALITNAGFADVIEIARQDRPSLYDIGIERPPPLVPRSRRLEVRGRLDATGRELQPVDADAVPPLPEGTDAVAICLLHADLDGSHERRVASGVRARDRVDVTCSSEVSPEFREYERTVTTVVNAYLRPACRPYVQAVDRLADEVLVMTSAGGLVPASEAAELPAAL